MFLIISFTLTLGQVQTNGVLQTLPLPPQERAARVDQDVNLVRAVRVAVARVRVVRAVVPQAPQMIKDGESLVRVGVLPPRPLVNRARVAVVQARVERVEADLVQVEIGVSVVHYLIFISSIPLNSLTHTYHIYVNLHRQARRLGRMGFIL